MCRARRVKCDERKPVCRRCEKIDRQCKWAKDPSDSSIPRLGVLQTTNPDFQISPSSLRDFEFFVHAGAPLISKWASPVLWCSTLPALSETSSATKFALLAVSTSTQLITNIASDAIGPSVERGEWYYRQACANVRTSRYTTIEEALAVSISLWNYSFLHGNQINTFIVHTNAAVKLLHALESDREAPIPRYSCRNDGQYFAKVVRGCMRDIHFPLQNQEFLKMLDRRAQRITDSACETELSLPITPHKNPFDELATPGTINSFFWLIIGADSKHSLHIIQQALADSALRSLQTPLPGSSAQAVFQNSIILCSIFCKIHLRNGSFLDLKLNDELMVEMLDLVQKNMQIWADEVKWNTDRHSNQSFGIGQHGIHCYLGILAFVGNQAHSQRIRLRASRMISTNGLSEV